MASFTDNILTFNPYISQMPVIEEMSRIGMAKQQKYDQGVQKIQSQIDNVAGLDVIRDVDKQYLQSKMNELGNNLKTVAAGDFSNFQLVNSVGGMVGQISKDPDIINAHASTQAYRKGMKDMEKYTKEGKGSPSNDWDFKTQADKWLNGDLKQSFGTNYNPYTNYRKNALEALKYVTKDETITDASFTQDSKGNFVPTDATTRTKLAGIAPEKLQQALMAVLTPADFKQMEVDGRYQYSNMDDKTFMSTVKSSYESNHNALIEQRSILSDAKTTTTSAQQKSQLDQQIGSIDKKLSQMGSEYENVSSTFASGNADAAKAKLGTANFINGFSRAFSNLQTSQTQETNPNAVMAMQRSKNNQDHQDFLIRLSQDDRHWQADYLLKEQALAIKQAKADKSKGGPGSGLYGGTGFTVNQDDVPIVAVEKVAANIERTTQELASSDQTFMKQRGKDQAWLDQQRVAYDKNPSGVDPVIKDYFQKTNALRKENDSLSYTLHQVTDEVTARHGGDVYAHIPKNAPSVNYITPSGAITFSPRDLVDYNTIQNSYQKLVETGIGMSGGPTMQKVEWLTDEAKKNLSSKQLLLYNIQKKEALQGSSSLTPNEQALFTAAKAVRDNINVPYQKTLTSIHDEVGEILKTKLSATQGVEYGIDLTDTAAKSQWANKLASFVDVAEKMKGGIANSPDFDLKALKQIVTDPETSNIRIVEGTRLQPSMYEITASGGKEHARTSFRVSAEQYHQIFGNMYEADPATKVARPYLEQIMRTPGAFSTAYDGKATTLQNSFLDNSDFQSVNAFGVSGNIENQGGAYSIRVNLHDPISGKWYQDIPYPQSGLIAEKAIAPALKNLNDYQAFELIHGYPPTASDMDKIKKATQNPSYGR
jgi:hypothetical protein